MKLQSPKWIIALGCVFLLAAGYFYVGVLFSGPRPECGRQIDGAFREYAHESHTNVFPNVNGRSDASLKLIEPYFYNEFHRDYGYVPGLRYDDGVDLVMLYLKEKTRYTWHGDRSHNVFSPKLWKIMSAQIDAGLDPEGGELVTTAEFKGRMQATLAFLKENQRPNWQAVVAEQTAFLNSIKE